MQQAQQGVAEGPPATTGVMQSVGSFTLHHGVAWPIKHADHALHGELSRQSRALGSLQAEPCLAKTQHSQFALDVMEKPDDPGGGSLWGGHAPSREVPGRSSTSSAPDTRGAPPAMHANAQQVLPPLLPGAGPVVTAPYMHQDIHAYEGAGDAAQRTVGNGVAELLRRGHDNTKLQALANRCAACVLCCAVLCCAAFSRLCTPTSLQRPCYLFMMSEVTPPAPTLAFISPPMSTAACMQASAVQGCEVGS